MRWRHTAPSCKCLDTGAITSQTRTGAYFRCKGSPTANRMADTILVYTSEAAVYRSVSVHDTGNVPYASAVVVSGAVVVLGWVFRLRDGLSASRANRANNHSGRVQRSRSVTAAAGPPRSAPFKCGALRTHPRAPSSCPGSLASARRVRPGVASSSR